LDYQLSHQMIRSRIYDAGHLDF